VSDDDTLGELALIGVGQPGARHSDSGRAYGEMMESLRDFLDKVAVARPDDATLDALASDLQTWSHKLTAPAADEPEPAFAYWPDLPGRGRALTPPFVVTGEDDRSVRGSVTFGRHFGGKAVHGGVVPLLLLDVLGHLVNAADRPRSRTAYLRTDFRAPTPVGPELSVSAWIVSEVGRKRLLRGEIRHGDTLCAEAEGLFVALRPDQV
jgi:acyl-coenzyme A thioesterase PaaI-like protein